MFTRRNFLGACGAGLIAAPLAFSAEPRAASRKKMAIVSTVWFYHSHSQHMGDRFLVGYPMHGKWHHPELDVVSVYADQQPAGSDLSRAREQEFKFKIYPT